MKDWKIDQLKLISAIVAVNFSVSWQKIVQTIMAINF